MVQTFSQDLVELFVHLYLVQDNVCEFLLCIGALLKRPMLGL